MRTVKEHNLTYSHVAWILFSFSLLKLIPFLVSSRAFYLVLFNLLSLALPVYIRINNARALYGAAYAFDLLIFNLGIFIFSIAYDLLFVEVDYSFQLYLLVAQFIINAIIGSLMYFPMININYLKSEK